MGWQIVERKIGRAGGEKPQAARQRDWDRQYRADAWAVGYIIAEYRTRAGMAGVWGYSATGTEGES